MPITIPLINPVRPLLRPVLIRYQQHTALREAFAAHPDEQTHGLLLGIDTSEHTIVMETIPSPLPVPIDLALLSDMAEGDMALLAAAYLMGWHARAAHASYRLLGQYVYDPDPQGHPLLARQALQHHHDVPLWYATPHPLIIGFALTSHDDPELTATAYAGVGTTVMPVEVELH